MKTHLLTVFSGPPKPGNATIFYAMVARRPDDLTRGLIGWTNLDEKRALLLDFGSTSLVNITMQGMSIPIDIVYFDADDHACLLVEDAQPNEPVPQSVVARSVAEFRAGTIRRLGMDRRDRQGHIATFMQLSVAHFVEN